LLKIFGDIGAREVVKEYIKYAKMVELKNGNSQFEINTQDDLKEYKGALK
jgi:CTP:molybdopterin cytidylyltransferase MocA